MCLVSIILYRTIMAILVSRSDNTVLATWVSLNPLLLLSGRGWLWTTHVHGSDPPPYIRHHASPASRGPW